MGRELWGLALAALVAGGGEALAAKAFGELGVQTTLTPTEVTLGMNFSWSFFSGAVADLSRSTLSSIPSLAENVERSLGHGYQVVLPSPGAGAYVQFFGYVKTDIVMDWPVGVAGAVAELALSWDQRRQYLWSYAWVHYGGAALRVKASLARADARVGSGMEVGVEGTTLRGLVVSLASQFGLTTDRAALSRAVSQGQVGGGMFEYRGATLGLGTLPVCCLSLSLTVRFTKAGFESARIATAYTFSVGEAAVLASATATFTPSAKTLTIVPRLTCPGTGSELYLTYSLVPATLGPGNFTVSGLRLEEASLSGVRLGEVTLSGRYSFAGSVYRGGLSGLPRYDLVLSLRQSTPASDLGIDLYFATEGDYPFGLGLVVFQVQATWLGDVQFSLTAEVATDTGWRRITFVFKYTFNLYGL